MNNFFRTEVKLLKALQGITYKQFADHIGTKTSSFYSWLKGQYDFSQQKIELLKEFISKNKEN